jgi:hypothetical protein
MRCLRLHKQKHLLPRLASLLLVLLLLPACRNPLLLLFLLLLLPACRHPVLLLLVVCYFAEAFYQMSLPGLTDNFEAQDTCI